MWYLHFLEKDGPALVTVVALLHFIIIEAAQTDVWSHWTTLRPDLYGPICRARITAIIVKTVQFGAAEPFFPAYALYLSEGEESPQKARLALGKKQRIKEAKNNEEAKN